MKLTKAQIDELYLFTDKHHVKYYDLQTELVDHLAQDIENQWEENPKITFDEGLRNAFRKFGIFGFEDVVNEKRNALMKRYRKWAFQSFKSFFKLPEIIGVLLSGFIIFMLFRIGIENPNIKLTLKVIIAFLIISVFVFSFIKLYSLKKKRKEKNYLMEEIIFNQGMSFSLFYTSTLFQVLIYSTNQHEIYWSIFNSIVILVMLLFAYISLIKIPRDANKYLKETYPYWDMV